MDGVEDGARVLERAPLAAVHVAGADPARVEEPGVGLVVLDLLRQHLGVPHRVQRQEGLREARREGRLGLRDAVLRARHLGCVARDEVEHGLRAVELGDRRQDAAGVAGQEDDVAGVVLGKTGDLGVADVLDGVRATGIGWSVAAQEINGSRQQEDSPSGVLGEGGVVVINLSGVLVEDDVLENGTEADGVEDIRLLLGRQTDALGIAATLDVEHAALAPAVLVIANQGAVGVGRESRLAGAG